MAMFLVFFSSRRRHTSWPRDWSSDVCSSDLRTLLHAHKNDPVVPVEVLRAHAIKFSLVPHSGVPRQDDDIAKQLEVTGLPTAGACGDQQSLFSIIIQP